MHGTEGTVVKHNSKAPTLCLFVLHVRYKAICDSTHFSTLTSINLLATFCGDQDRERQTAEQIAEIIQKSRGERTGILQKRNNPTPAIQLADFSSI